jgi:excisionase family DNA binding protein
MSTDERLAIIEAKQDAILRLLTPAAKSPGLTVKAFAERIGVHRDTVQRWIRDGKIRKEKGRIPFEQLTPYIS